MKNVTALPMSKTDTSLIAKPTGANKEFVLVHTTKKPNSANISDISEETNKFTAGWNAFESGQSFYCDENGAWPREADSQGAILKYVCVITVSQ